VYADGRDQGFSEDRDDGVAENDTCGGGVDAAVASAWAPSPHAPMTVACRNASCSRTLNLMPARLPTPPAMRTASNSIDPGCCEGPLHDLGSGAFAERPADGCDDSQDRALWRQRGSQLANTG
jgi:hypothetical protein